MSANSTLGCLIHINGAPGVGKLTIASSLGRRLNARVLDNHAIYNVAFALTNFPSPEFFDAVRAVRRAAYDQILRLPTNNSVILTDAYFDDSDWAHESWSAIEELGKVRGSLFSIAIICAPAEHCRRIVSADRKLRGKLVDEGYVKNFSHRRLIERGGDLSLRVDVTKLTADGAAAQLAEWINAHSR